MKHSVTTDEAAALLYFLMYLKNDQPGLMYGGRRVEEAWLAACKTYFPDAPPEEIEQTLQLVGA